MNIGVCGQSREESGSHTESYQTSVPRSGWAEQLSGSPEMDGGNRIGIKKSSMLGITRTL